MHKHREHLHGHRHADMISVEDARERILGFFAQLDSEERAISDALGQVLTEDIVGRFDVPPWDNSAMDGYALRAEDIEDAHPDAPVTLNVVGSIAAGELPTQGVRAGAAIRIMTGAPLPDGADAVVPFEDTDEGERGMGGHTPNEISVRIPVPPSGNIRPAGGDIAGGRDGHRGGHRPTGVGDRGARVARLRDGQGHQASGRGDSRDGQRAYRAVGAVPTGKDIQLQQLRRGGGGAGSGRDSQAARHRARHGRVDLRRSPRGHGRC